MKFYKILSILFFFIVIFLSIIKSSYAIEDPFIVPNNPFGIHILDENDLEDAAKLVNSSGGDWGYVTLVIRKDERDVGRWQRVFDRMRELHLIPIIRVATRQINGGWEKPNVDEIDGWVSFFEELNWVIKNRYIIIGNEPNHAPEWGGSVNPEEYSNYYLEFSIKLKNTSPEYFVMPAGLDASAPNSEDTMNEADFIKRMVYKNPDFFKYVDGWSSHSYPNPGFSGSEDSHGKGTVRTFEWELDYLNNLGISKALPVFVTETGWAHDMDLSESVFSSSEDVSKKIVQAFETAWKNEKIVAITPFLLNYQDEPFNKFSWKKSSGEFYDFYYKVRDLPKTAGNPQQHDKADILALIIPPLFYSDGGLQGIVYIKNIGQKIWNDNHVVNTRIKNFPMQISPFKSKVLPGEKTFATIKVIL